MLGPADDLFFDLEVNPLGQALQVDGTTWTHADTRVEQEVLSIFSLFQADFALRFFFVFGRFTVLSFFLSVRVVFHDVSAGVNSGLVFTGRSGDFSIDAGFADKELDSAEFDDLARFEFVAQVFAIFLLEFADDEVRLLFGFVFAGVRLVGIEALVFVDFLLLGAVDFGRKV